MPCLPQLVDFVYTIFYPSIINFMKKVLGLDLGSSSIGWALIHQPETADEKYHIAGMGVRIIPLSKDDADEFTKGNAISKNASRTLKRGMRRSMASSQQQLQCDAYGLSCANRSSGHDAPQITRRNHRRDHGGGGLQ